MEVEEAATKIKEFVQQQRGAVSFIELENLLGNEAKGDLWLGQEGWNIWWWFGMSPLFIEALRSLQEEIAPRPTTVMVYVIDGSVPALPIAKRALHYKEPHWLPVSWDVRVSARQPFIRWGDPNILNASKQP